MDNYNCKKGILIFLIIFFLLGCSTTINKRHKIYLTDEFYVLKLYSGKEWMPEYMGLKEKITKQELRSIPSYLQDCYEKE